MNAELTFHGAAECVTGSCTLQVVPDDAARARLVERLSGALEPER